MKLYIAVLDEFPDYMTPTYGNLGGMGRMSKLSKINRKLKSAMKIFIKNEDESALQGITKLTNERKLILESLKEEND